MPAKKQRSERKVMPSKHVVGRSLDPIVRLVPIDFMDIYRQTGMRRGRIGFSAAWGWCAYRHSPEDGLADCAMFTPPSMEPGETELRIVNGTHWEFSKPNPKGERAAHGTEEVR